MLQNVKIFDEDLRNLLISMGMELEIKADILYNFLSQKNPNITFELCQEAVNKIYNQQK